MKHTLSLLLIVVTCSAFAQSRDPLILPKDDGKATSFCESIEYGRKAGPYFDTLCSRLKESHFMKVSYVNGEEMLAYFQFSEAGHGIVSTLNLSRRGRYVNYCFHDYKVDGVPLDQWLTTAVPFAAEQVKSAVFARTVLALAEIKNSGVTTSMR